MSDPISIAITVIKVVKTAVTVYKAWAATHAIAAFAIKAAAILAAGSVATALTKKKPKISGQQLDFKADPEAGQPILFGRSRVGGNLIFQYPSGPNNKHLNMFSVLSGCGPIEGIEQFKIADEVVTWNNSTGAVTNNPKFKNKFWIKTALGVLGAAALTQPSVPAASGPLTEWTSAHKLSGYAAAWLDAEYDTNVWTASLAPEFIALGVKCYDPRDDDTYPGGSGNQRIDDQSTWQYTENAPIAGLTYLLGWKENGKLTGGCGIPPSGIDIASFVESANVSDANNWKLGGQITMLDSRWQTLKDILQAGGAEPVASSAVISCVTNTPRTSLDTIELKDLAAGCAIPGTQTRRDRKNTIIPRYRSETHNWEVVSAGPVSASSYVTIDGKERRLELDFPLVQQAKQAGELGAYHMVNSREFGPLPLVLKPSWMGYKAGDALDVNIPELGLNNQQVLVKSRQLDPDTGAVTLVVYSETAGKHAYALGQTAQPPQTAGLTNPNFAIVPAPLEGQWTSAAGDDFLGLPTVVITGSTSDNAFCTDIVIEYRSSSDKPWVTWGTATPDKTRIDVTGIQGLQGYEIAVSYRTIYHSTGARLTLPPVTTGPLISNDTDNVGGRPSDEVLDDIANAAQDAIDAYELTEQEILDRTAADEAEALARSNAILVESVARADAIAASAAVLQDQIDTIADQVSEITSTPYDNAVTYSLGDTVTYLGKLYQAKGTTTGNLPTNTTYWTYIGDYSSIGDQVAANTVAISGLQSDVATINGSLTAEITSRQTLATQLRGSYTGTDINSVSFTQGLIYSEKQARSTETGSLATSINGLNARLTTAEGSITTQATALTSLTTRVSTAEGTILSQATSITNLQSSINLSANSGSKLPSTFVGGLNNWTNVKTGDPATIANPTIGSLATGDADFGNCYSASWTASGTVLLTKGVVPIVAGRVYEIKVRFKPNAADNNVTYGIIVAELGATYSSTADSILAGTTINTNNSVVTLTAKISTVAGTGISTFNSLSKQFRYGLRLGTTETTNTVKIGSIECNDVTDANNNAIAIQSIDTRVTATEDEITSISGTLTALTATVGTKASTTALNALTAVVTSQGDAIDAQSSSITNLQSSLNLTANTAAILPSTFVGGFGTWTSSRVGSPSSVPDLASVTLANDAVFGPSASITNWNAAGANLGPKGVVQVIAGRIYEVRTRYRLVSSDGSVAFNHLLQCMDKDYTQGALANVTGTSMTASGTTALELVSRFSTAVLSGVFQIPAGTIQIRPMFRLNSAETSMTLAVAQHSIVDITDAYNLSTATQSLDTRLTSAEGSIATSSAAITNLQSVVASSGGDNLIYNPSFEVGVNPNADGWASGATAGVTLTPSLIASGFEDGGRAQQLSFTGMGSGKVVDLVPLAQNYPKITAGENYTQSAYFQATAGLIVQLYTQWLDSGGVALSQITTQMNATSGWQRIQVSGLAPASSVRSRLYYRVISPTIASGVIRWDKAQFEQGLTATVFRDNGLATSSALSSLTTRVTAAENEIDVVSTSLTSLTATVGTKASATAVNALDVRVTATENTNTSQASSISSLSATVGGHTGSITSLQSVTATQTGQITSLQLKAGLLLDANNKVIGWQANNGATSGDFIIRADKFYVAASTGSGVSIFTVDTVNNLVIATNLRVDTLQIKQGAVTTNNSNIYTNRQVNSTSSPIINQCSLTTIGGSVEITGAIWCDALHGSTFYLDIYRNGTLIHTIPKMQLTTYSPKFPVFYMDVAAPSGTNAYSWRARLQSGSDPVIGVDYTYMNLNEFRR